MLYVQYNYMIYLNKISDILHYLSILNTIFVVWWWDTQTASGSFSLVVNASRITVRTAFSLVFVHTISFSPFEFASVCPLIDGLEQLTGCTRTINTTNYNK